MAEQISPIFIQRPYFIHYISGEFKDIFQVYRPEIEKYGRDYLEACIRIQEKKEEYIYKFLELQPQEWKKIGERLFGVFEGEGENKKTLRENRMASFLEGFTKFFNEEIFQNISTKNFTGKENASDIAVPGKTFNDIAQDFINAFNNPIDEFLKWYNNSDLKNKENFTEKDLYFLNNIFKGYRTKDSYSNILDSDGKIRDVQSIGESNAMELLRKSTGILNNLIGAIGEQATISLKGNWNNTITGGVKRIIQGVGTSDYTKDLDEDADTENIKRSDLIAGNIEFYKQKESIINSILEKENVILSSKTGGLTFGITYSDQNNSTLAKNLKADEIFTFKIELNGQLIDFEKFGISSKTAWGAKADTLKLYSGSLQSAFENMFKGLIMNEETGGEYVSNTGKIINFLQYSILNAGASGYYDKNISNKTAMSRNVKDVLDKIIDYYAYQWFTGGISPQTHADFFSIYGNGHHYFIPMSIILKEILKSKKPFLANDLYKVIDTKTFGNVLTKEGNKDLSSYISKEQYESIKELQNYDDMLNFGRAVFNSGIIRDKKKVKGLDEKGKEIEYFDVFSKSSGSINLTKSKLIKKLGYMV